MKRVAAFLLALAVLLVVLFFQVKTRRSNFRDKGSNIGNILCTYFYDMGCHWRDGKKFMLNSIDDRDFYKNFPTEVDIPVDLPTLPVLKGEPDPFDVWHLQTDEALEFWSKMKPYIHKILGETLVKSGLQIEQKNPVIHFRCADIPFNKHRDYHLLKYDFYKQAIAGQKEVDIIYCNTHKTSELEQKACDEYAEYLKNELAPVKANIVCGTINEDFARMFYAPMCISSGSSMSFMAGYFGKGTFVKWDEKYIVEHDLVENYYDTKHVHENYLR